MRVKRSFSMLLAVLLIAMSPLGCEAQAFDDADDAVNSTESTAISDEEIVELITEYVQDVSLSSIFDDRAFIIYKNLREVRNVQILKRGEVQEITPNLSVHPVMTQIAFSVDQGPPLPGQVQSLEREAEFFVGKNAYGEWEVYTEDEMLLLQMIEGS